MYVQVYVITIKSNIIVINAALEFVLYHLNIGV